MTEKENKLIEDLFKQAAQQQIEDNGFTERVMGQLPARGASTERRLSRLWTLFCVATALALFILLGGWESLKATMMVWLSTALTSVEVFFTTAPTTELPVNPAVVLLALAFVLIYLPYQTARKLSEAL